MVQAPSAFLIPFKGHQAVREYLGASPCTASFK
jgi:hypothetical protein